MLLFTNLQQVNIFSSIQVRASIERVRNFEEIGIKKIRCTESSIILDFLNSRNWIQLMRPLHASLRNYGILIDLCERENNNQSNDKDNLYLMTTIYFTNHQKWQLVDFFKKIFMHYLCKNLFWMQILKIYSKVKAKISVPWQ